MVLHQGHMKLILLGWREQLVLRAFVVVSFEAVVPPKKKSDHFGVFLPEMDKSSDTGTDSLEDSDAVWSTFAHCEQPRSVHPQSLPETSSGKTAEHFSSSCSSRLSRKGSVGARALGAESLAKGETQLGLCSKKMRHKVNFCPLATPNSGHAVRVGVVGCPSQGWPRFVDQLRVSFGIKVLSRSSSCWKRTSS